MISTKNDQKRDIKHITVEVETLLTVFSTFILGYLDVFSEQYSGSAVVSAQTGNLMQLGKTLAQRDFSGALEHFSLFLGFAFGCGLAFLIANFVKSPIKNWLIFSIIIYVTAILYSYLSIDVMDLMLSASAGIALTFFRNMSGVDLNNGIHTGNLKNLWSSLVNVVIFRHKEDSGKLERFSIVIFCFLLGSFIGGLTLSMGPKMMLLLVSGMCLMVQVGLLIPHFYNSRI